MNKKFILYAVLLAFSVAAPFLFPNYQTQLATLWLIYGLQRELRPDPALRRALPQPRLAGWTKS